jgi:hypothetical protein
MYALQRSNGDWFSLNDYGRLRIPVFSSSNHAMEARAHNPAMLLFKPVVLDEGLLNEIAATEGETKAAFWLVSNPSLSPRQGRPMECASLSLLISESAEGSPA